MDWLEKLREIKSKTSETYKSISEKTNIAQTTIEKLFCGRTKDPKLTMMRDIIHCLGYTLDDLVENSPNTKTSYSEQTIYCIELFEKLNPNGKQKATEYIEDLSENPKYTTSTKEQGITVEEHMRATLSSAAQTAFKQSTKK